MTPREDSYHEIITLFLSGYYFCCRQMFSSDGHIRKWMKDEHEIGRAYEDLDGVYSSTVEKLMLEVIMLILTARRGTTIFLCHSKRNIDKILGENNLNYLLQTLSGNELLELKADLWLCGLYKDANIGHELKEINQLIYAPIARFSQRERYKISCIVDDILDECGTYGEIRILFLEHYYHYCRIKLASPSPWAKGEREIYYAYTQLQALLETPFEGLMLEVLLLILDAGRSTPAFQKEHRDKIHILLDQYDFVSMVIEQLPEIGAWEFGSDLVRLGFWDYKEFIGRLETYNS